MIYASYKAQKNYLIAFLKIKLQYFIQYKDTRHPFMAKMCIFGTTFASNSLSNGLYNIEYFY